MWRYWLIFLFIILSVVVLFAQQTSRVDSIWVSEMMAGKDTLRLKPEYLKAIEEGTLLNLGRPLELGSSELPLLKDFSEYIRPDTFRRILSFDSIPRGVFLLYPVNPIGTAIREAAYRSHKSLVVRDQLRLGNSPVYGRAGTQNLFLPEVKDGQRRGSVGATFTVEFSAEHMLRSIFWKSERDKKRNRKRDFTRKHYNSYP